MSSSSGSSDDCTKSSIPRHSCAATSPTTDRVNDESISAPSPAGPTKARGRGPAAGAARGSRDAGPSRGNGALVDRGPPQGHAPPEGGGPSGDGAPPGVGGPPGHGGAPRGGGPPRAAANGESRWWTPTPYDLYPAEFEAASLQRHAVLTLFTQVAEDSFTWSHRCGRIYTASELLNQIRLWETNYPICMEVMPGKRIRFSLEVSPQSSLIYIYICVYKYIYIHMYI